MKEKQGDLLLFYFFFTFLASKWRCCVFFCVPRRLKQEFQLTSHQNVGVAFFFAQTGISAHIESTFTRASSSSTFFWFSPVHVLAHRNFRNSRFSPNRRFLRNRDDKWPLRASKAPILTKWISAFWRLKHEFHGFDHRKSRCCVLFCVPRRLKHEVEG